MEVCPPVRSADERVPLGTAEGGEHADRDRHVRRPTDIGRATLPRADLPECIRITASRALRVTPWLRRRGGCESEYRRVRNQPDIGCVRTLSNGDIGILGLVGSNRSCTALIALPTTRSTLTATTKIDQACWMPTGCVHRARPGQRSIRSARPDPDARYPSWTLSDAVRRRKIYPS
jgi:hypothetical protein